MTPPTWQQDGSWLRYVGLHPRGRRLALAHDGEQAVAAYKRSILTLEAEIAAALYLELGGSYITIKRAAAAARAVLAVLEDDQ